MKMQATLTAAAVAVALGFSSAAPAQPTFPFRAYGGFAVGSDSGFPDPVYNNPTTLLRIPDDNSVTSEFAWGTPQTDAGKSRLIINSPGLPQVQTVPGRHIDEDLEISSVIDPGGAPDPGGSVFGHLSHDNNTIDEIFQGATVGIDYYLDIYAPNASGDPTGDPIATLGLPFEFELDVWETSNSADPCPNGDPNPCDDRFRYRLIGAGGGFGEDFIDQTLGTFSYEGETYRVSSTGFFQEGGGLAGEFWTVEEEDVTTTGTVRIEAHAVPAPAPLGLLGLGLLGLAWLGGRRRPMAV